MSNTVILYTPHFVTKEVEVEYEEEVDVGLFIQRIVKQKEMKKVLRRINNSNGINLIKMELILLKCKFSILMGNI